MSKVKIRIAEAKKFKKSQFNKSIFISFNYHPETVLHIRELEERHYNPDTKEWEVPFTQIFSLLKDSYLQLDLQKDFPYDEDLAEYVAKTIEEKQKEKEKAESLKVQEIPNDFKFKTKPFDHQIEGVRYGLKTCKFILGDDQGLGKTKQVIDIVNVLKQENKAKTCLIICCVNSLKFNWEEEVETHSNMSSWILGNRMNKKTKKWTTKGTKEKVEDLQALKTGQLETDFIITNVETLRDKVCLEYLKELIMDGTINIVAVDEIHKCKDCASQQGKGLLELATDYRIAMSGTLVINNPLDLYVPLRWIGKETHNYHMFKNYYCEFGGFGNAIVGYKHLETLKELLDTCMLRRLKNKVLNLPDKIKQIEYVEMNEKQKRLYAEVKGEIQQELSQMKTNLNPLAQLTRLRQVTGNPQMFLDENDTIANPKLDRAEEIIENAIATNDKVVIFSNWTSITDEAIKRFNKYNPAVITGEIKDRQEQVHKFMNDETCKVIIGTIGAMGTGLTLTAASTVIFLDSPWARAYKDQAEDRCHRIGQNKTVNYYTIVCKDTIDENIEKIIYKKGVISDCLVDGKMDLKSMELALALIE